MRVRGHGLRREGRAYDAQGCYTGRNTGHAVCECGIVSDELPSTAARQRWHREVHKAAIAADQRRASDVGRRRVALRRRVEGAPT